MAGWSYRWQSPPSYHHCESTGRVAEDTIEGESSHRES